MTLIDHVEVTPGPGTVIRYGSIVAWAAAEASPALISFLAQSARNLGPSPRGGRQISDHIARVLTERDPEPKVAFAVIGPSTDGWVALLHGPAHAWDGQHWSAPAREPGWLQILVDPSPSLAITAGGRPPTISPDSMMDLEAGVVPGAGFVLMPDREAERRNRLAPEPAEPAEPAEPIEPVLAVEPAEPAEPGPGAGREQPAQAGEEPTSVLSLPEVTVVMPAVGGSEEIGRGAHFSRLRGSAEGAEPRSPDLELEGVFAPSGDEWFDDLEVDLDETTWDRSGEAGAGPGLAEPIPEPAEPEEPPGPNGSINLRRRRAPNRAAVPLPLSGQMAPAPAGASLVSGVLCPSSHLNRPGMPACARCGAALPDAGAALAVSGVRPALGSLVVDDGGLYRLDRGYIIGSNPGRDPTVRSGLALPLALSGDDVSTTHAELRLTDWDVLVIDRGSAAGTSVFEPGGSTWVRLAPYEPRPLLPGTHVAFGQRIVTLVTPWVAGPTGGQGSRGLDRHET